MSFTFGGFEWRFMKSEYTTRITMEPPRGTQTKMKEILQSHHVIFTLEPLLMIIRDYILGAPLLLIDLFPKKNITIHELHILLCSVACCHQCTVEVIDLLSDCTLTAIEVREEEETYVDHKDGYLLIGRKFNMEYIPRYYVSLLACKYVLMRNLQSFNYMLERVHMKDKPFISLVRDNIMGEAYWKNTEPFNIYKVLPESTFSVPITELCKFCHAILEICGIEALSSTPITRRKLKNRAMETRIHEGYSYLGHSSEYLPSILASCVTSPDFTGEEIRIGLRHLRKAFPRDIYYNSLLRTGSISPESFFTRPDLNLRLEDAIVTSMNCYFSISTKEVRPDISRINFLWRLPSLLLEKHCKVVGRSRGDDNFPHMTVIHNHETYHVRMGILEPAGGEVLLPLYSYNQHECISYGNLLFIIAKRFLWTYDREHVLDILKSHKLTSDVPDVESMSDPIRYLLVPAPGDSIPILETTHRTN